MNNVLLDHPTSFETGPGYENVENSDVYRIRFYSNNTDGFSGIISVTNDGIGLPFSCQNCEDGSNVSLDRLYLDFDMTRSTSSNVSRCSASCDFYRNGRYFLKIVSL